MKKKTVSVKGLSFTGFEEDYVFQTIEKTQDFYEAPLLEQWSPLVQDPGIILDVGANLGNHTLFWSRFFPNAGIVAMEPFPDNYDCLCQNVADNGLSQVRPLQAAAGEKAGFAHVTGFQPTNLGATTFQYSEPGDELTAEVRTLDSVSEDLQLTGIGLVKIDTEGFELSVLKGMQGILERDRPVLWVECGPESIPEILRILREKKYLLLRLEGANLLFFPAEKAPEGEISTERLLVSNLSLLQRVHQYYQNYETSKKWLASQNRKLEALRKQMAGVTEEKEQFAARAKTAEQLHNELLAELSGVSEEKGRLAAELTQCSGELKAARDAASRLERECGDYRARLARDAELLGEEQTFLSALRRQLQQMNSQLQLAKQQNAAYLEKLNKVYGTWYGRIALRAYKALKKLKHFLIRK